MRQGTRWPSPALVIAFVALFAALGGTVYAAKKINGRTIRVKSLPGNRIKPRSVPANRLKGNVLRSLRIKGPLTGADINELTLGRVPSAGHAETADSAQSAVDAQTALNAVNAIDAQTINGHTAGCASGHLPFAGACWRSSPFGAAATAPDAAADCAAQGGSLPEALQLAAFAKRPDVNLDAGDEWSSDLWNYSAGPYGVATVTESGAVGSALSTAERHYRCVMPFVS